MEALLPTDDSPFLLGDIAPGKPQLALESNMSRSAGFPTQPAVDGLPRHQASCPTLMSHSLLTPHVSSPAAGEP